MEVINAGQLQEAVDWSVASKADPVEVAAVLVRDAIKRRKAKHPLDPASLFWYQIYEHRLWHAFVVVMSLVHMSLAFFEDPGSSTPDAAPFPTTEIIELFLTLVYVADVLVYIAAWGKDPRVLLRESKWRAGSVAVILAIQINTIIALAIPGCYRLRWLRAFFPLEKTHRLRKVCAFHCLRAVGPQTSADDSQRVQKLPLRWSRRVADYYSHPDVCNGGIRIVS